MYTKQDIYEYNESPKKRRFFGTDVFQKFNLFNTNTVDWSFIGNSFLNKKDETHQRDIHTSMSNAKVINKLRLFFDTFPLLCALYENKDLFYHC